MTISEKRGCHVTHFLIFSSFWVVRAQKNKLSIFMGVNLHAGDEVGPLSGSANSISKPTISFAQFKIELEWLS